MKFTPVEGNSVVETEKKYLLQSPSISAQCICALTQRVGETNPREKSLK